jgi:lipopolysaccharide assembly outer membrane protein LptD (OstA)
MTQLNAQIVTAQFASGTNALKQVLAEQNVVISQGARTARGQQGLYNVPAEILTLTGEPTLMAPEGNITQATIIAYDIAENKFFSKDVRVESDKAPKPNLNLKR